MNFININRKNESFYGFLGSVALHLLVLSFTVIVLKAGSAANYSSSGGGYYVDLTDVKGSVANQSLESGKRGLQKPEDDLPSPENRNEAAGRISEKAKETKKSIPEPKGAGSAEKTFAPSGAHSRNSHGFLNIETAGFDSTSLGQFYQEPTLNVRLKYPQGWVYIDQQRREKLDGITFWASGSNFNPPPYIHVEVVEKYIFNPDQYKFKFDFEKFTGFYNEPVELEDQISQLIYIRTDDDEDYTIKLIMGNPEAFKQFQPVFFAIIKSFDFGRSFL